MNGAYILGKHWPFIPNQLNYFLVVHLKEARALLADSF